MDYSLKNIVKSVEARGYEVDKKPFKLKVI